MYKITQEFEDIPTNLTGFVESDYGVKAWYVNGKLHREGGLPAIEHQDGTKFWYVNGQLHRDGGLPAIEYSNGDKYWHVHGKLVTSGENK